MAVFRRVTILINLVILIHEFVDSSNLFACPAMSVCVPPQFCPSENVTFNVLGNHTPSQPEEEKYVCGLLEETEAFVCCSDPTGMPHSFSPNETIWFFSEENRTTDKKVIPYPGLQSTILDHNDTSETETQPCPLTSLCVRPSMCPQNGITFTSALMLPEEKYTCGQTAETDGYVCCSIRTVGDGLGLKNHDNVPFIFTVSNDIDLENEIMDFEVLDLLREENVLQFAAASQHKGDMAVSHAKEFKEATGRSTDYDDPWVCGRTLDLARETARIYDPFGNRTASEGNFPWHVAIISTGYTYLCSGVVVADKVVLTVAHCLDGYTASQILVRVGDVDLEHDNEVYPTFDVRVSLIVQHPDYEKIRLESDIAVIELQESLRSLANIRPACLPHDHSPAINRCAVPGWGQISRSKEELNEFSHKLRVAPFYIIEKGSCQTSFRKTKELGAFFKLQNSVLCAKGFSNADTCKGDGGSGLVCRDNEVFVLKGLVSYGLGCGSGLPGVYTDVELFLDFIKNYKDYLEYPRINYPIEQEHLSPHPVSHLYYLPPQPGPHPDYLPPQSGSHPDYLPPQSGSHPDYFPPQSGSHPDYLPPQPGPHPDYLPPQPGPHPDYLPPQPGPHPDYLPPQPGPHPDYLPPQPGPHPDYLPSQPGPHPDYLPPQPGPHPEYLPPQPGPHPDYFPPQPGPHSDYLPVPPKPQPGPRPDYLPLPHKPHPGPRPDYLPLPPKPQPGPGPRPAHLKPLKPQPGPGPLPAHLQPPKPQLGPRPLVDHLQPPKHQPVPNSGYLPPQPVPHPDYLPSQPVPHPDYLPPQSVPHPDYLRPPKPQPGPLPHYLPPPPPPPKPQDGPHDDYLPQRPYPEKHSNYLLARPQPQQHPDYLSPNPQHNFPQHLPQRSEVYADSGLAEEYGIRRQDDYKYQHNIPKFPKSENLRDLHSRSKNGWSDFILDDITTPESTTKGLEYDEKDRNAPLSVLKHLQRDAL